MSPYDVATGRDSSNEIFSTLSIPSSSGGRDGRAQTCNLNRTQLNWNGQSRLRTSNFVQCRLSQRDNWWLLLLERPGCSGAGYGKSLYTLILSGRQ